MATPRISVTLSDSAADAIVILQRLDPAAKRASLCAQAVDRGLRQMAREAGEEVDKPQEKPSPLLQFGPWATPSRLKELLKDGSELITELAKMTHPEWFGESP